MHRCKYIGFTSTCFLRTCGCPGEEHHQPVLENSCGKRGKKGNRRAKEGWEEGAHLEAETPFASASPPYKRQGGPLDSARTLPPGGGNKVEQGLLKSSCLEADPRYLLVLWGEILKFGHLMSFFSGPQTERQIFFPQRYLKLSLTRLKWCARSRSSPRGFNFQDYSEICKSERC